MSGEWSLGKAFDLHLFLSESTDTYLGRILTDLDPLNKIFFSLTPHFSLEDPMGNEYVTKAMTMMYGPILECWAGTQVKPTSLLLWLLPSMVHHSDFLFEVIRSVPGHPFLSILLLQNLELLGCLKELATTKPTENMKTATGIPPHIHLAVMMKSVLDCCRETLDKSRK